MDVNGDGKLDILSGSYSRMEQDMAGLFQVLHGTDDGFSKAQVLNGTDGKPLIAQPSEDGGDGDLDKICTRPTAVDLDGDGKLDLVTGNFGGTFAFFKGEGEGRFAPENSWLTSGGNILRVPQHSDPFFVDWDGDGDMDMLSGSSEGGVFMFPNEGSTTEPSFGNSVTLLEPSGHGYDEGTVFGDSHITKPGGSTRVWADDVNGDGKLDLLVGDSVTIHIPAEGLDEATCRKKLAELDAKQSALIQKMQGDLSEDESDALDEQFEKLWLAREDIVQSTGTGYVWLVLQK